MTLGEKATLTITRYDNHNLVSFKADHGIATTPTAIGTKAHAHCLTS